MILPSVAEVLGRVGLHPAVSQALDALRSGAAEARLAGLTDAAKALIAAQAAAALDRPTLVLVESNQRAETLAEPLRFFFQALTGKSGPWVSVVPAYDVLPYQKLSPHPEICEARAAAVWRLVSGQASVLLVPVASAAMRMRDAEFYRSLAQTLERDRDSPFEALVEHLAAVGYERHDTVEMPGQFAVRGGILDVFSPEALRPVRAEFFGDTVESLREFDPSTQRSIRPIERTTLLPLAEVPRMQSLWAKVPAAAGGQFSEEELQHARSFPGWEFAAAQADPPGGTLVDLAGPCLVILDEPEVLTDALARFSGRVQEAYERAGEGSAAPATFYLDPSQWEAALARPQRLSLEHLALERPDRPIGVVATQPTTRYHGNVSAFFTEMKARVDAGEEVLVSAATIGELERLADLCHEYDMPYRLGTLDESATMTRLAGDSSGGSVPAATLVKAPLAEGVAFPGLKLLFFGNTDLFETIAAPERPKRRVAAGTFFSDFRDLKPGDFVVHVDHGIGQFDGLRQMQTEGTTGEFMLLRYAEDARLYVPLARLDLVQKYTALGGVSPALDRLGGTGWVNRKKKARKAISDMADELLKLYAERKTIPGVAFSPDVAWQKEFDDAFEFVETSDQLRAIEDVKRDLERAVPMDRLLCGDVGYGKTEVAMRAAFKAVCDNKQVAVLAPTTVLAFQHYQTFRQRFGAFPARIEMLSRFRTAKQQKETLAGLESGKVDVVIGTHRLLSKDVRFQDLGLLIVDEEQRFGVTHKERIKQMRSNVDVLTLSATPIPRTLHMSLVGLRDMSVIETPPKDRLAIQTVVAPFQERLVQSAIEQELGREGQVYFVHNRVESIYSLASLVQKLVPQARVLVGHGQMPEKELEDVMLRFIRHEADVLVATTIIENGLDIPRCNTIVINRADRLGLSELYQLRGRVGRSNQRAYAYLLVPPEGSLSELARKRLAALKEFSELGAGFRIAALDLELRGAGNLLGREQHGHVNAIGFDLYCQMMERAVAERKGEVPAAELRTTINLGLDIRIPPGYIDSEGLRLRTYKRIAGVASDAEREEVLRELEDRFGAPPAAVGNLLDYAVLKALCERLLVASVERRSDQIALKFYEQTPVKPEQVVKLIRRHKGVRLDPAGVLWIPGDGGKEGAVKAVRRVLLELQA